MWSADGATPGFVADVMAKSGYELRLRSGRRSLRLDDPVGAMSAILLAKPVDEVVADRSRAQDQDVIIRPEARHDGLHEPVEVFLAVAFVSVLGASAAMADHRVVADVAGGPVVRRHLRYDPVYASLLILPADDDGLGGVDPDEGPAAHGAPPIVAVTHPGITAHSVRRRAAPAHRPSGPTLPAERPERLERPERPRSVPIGPPPDQVPSAASAASASARVWCTVPGACSGGA